jgi:hypothetical protein
MQSIRMQYVAQLTSVIKLLPYVQLMLSGPITIFEFVIIYCCIYIVCLDVVKQSRQCDGW